MVPIIRRFANIFDGAKPDSQHRHGWSGGWWLRGGKGDEKSRRITRSGHDFASDVIHDVLYGAPQRFDGRLAEIGTGTRVSDVEGIKLLRHANAISRIIMAIQNHWCLCCGEVGVAMHVLTVMIVRLTRDRLSASSKDYQHRYQYHHRRQRISLD